MNPVWIVTQEGRLEDHPQCYLVCLAHAVAVACAQHMNDFMERLITRLPEYPDLPPNYSTLPGGAPEGDEYRRMLAKRTAAIKRVRWPYGINREGDIGSSLTVFVQHLQYQAKP